eukprot:1750963-Rhodomonas_salina.3
MPVTRTRTRTRRTPRLGRAPVPAPCQPAPSDDVLIASETRRSRTGIGSENSAGSDSPGAVVLHKGRGRKVWQRMLTMMRIRSAMCAPDIGRNAMALLPSRRWQVSCFNSACATAMECSALTSRAGGNTNSTTRNENKATGPAC